MGDTDLTRGRRARDFVAVAGAVAMVALFLVWLIFDIGGARATMAFDDISSTVVSLTAGLMCVFYTGRRVAHRRPWMFIGVAVIAWGLGDIVWTVYEVFLSRPVPFPSLADVGYLAMIPLAVAGLLAFPSLRARAFLDGTIVVLSFFCVSWVIVLEHVYADGSGSMFARVIGLAYPASDVVLLSMVVFVAARTRPVRAPLILLAVGFAALAVSDSAFALLTTSGSYGGSDLLDTGWIAGFLLIGLAAYFAREERPEAEVPERPSWFRTFLPYAGVPVFVGLFVRRELAGNGLGAPLIVTGAGLFLAILVRQFIIVRENVALAQRLERVLKKRTHELVSSEEMSHSILETANDAFMSMDADGHITAWNGKAEELFAWPREEVEGRPFVDVIVSRAEPEGALALERFLRKSADNLFGRRLEIVLLDRSGREFPAEVTAWAVHRAGTTRYNMFVRDISERREFEGRLEHQALHDPLTGFANRALFRDRLSHALIRRHNSHVGVLFIDIDDFKTVNDSLGHAAGDELLIAISSRIADCLRPEDTVARLGGDEFAILVDPIVSQETAREVAERTMRALERPFRIGDHDVFARASIGIAVGRGSESSADAVLADADLAMYAAKTGGKNRYEIFDPRMRDAAMRRMELNSDLRTAIERGEFFMLYQPIVDLKDGRVVGAEALVRWDHPTRGVVGPERFLPLAEETGFIVPLGRWVFERAAMQAVEWTAHDPDFVISINVSPRQFREARSIEGIEAALAMSDLEPHSLIIEITESMMLDDSDGAARQLEGMRALGVRIAVDDFGTGYSSLGRLGRLPVDILKIDRSFVSGVDTSAEDSAVARAIVRLAEIWGLSVTAEGIETESQRDELLSMGCQRGQGFWYSQPITAPELTELIARGPRAALRAVAG